MNPLTDIPDVWNWCDVDMMNRADGSFLSTITDQTGQGHGFHQFDGDPAKYPIVRAGVLNGRSVAEGDGVDDLLDSVAAIPYGPRTVFVVQRVLSIPISSFAKHPYVSGGGWERLTFTLTPHVWQWYQDWDIAPPGIITRLIGESKLQQWRLLIYRINSESSQDVSINGKDFVNLVPLINIWSGPSNQTDRLFAHSGSDCCHCQIALHGTVMRSVQGTELTRITDYIHNRFNLYPELHMPGKIKEAEALLASGDPGEGGGSGTGFDQGLNSDPDSLFVGGGGGAVTTGNNNVAIGADAGLTLTTGSYNLIIGPDSAGNGIESGQVNTIVGVGAAGASAAADSEITALGSYTAGGWSNSPGDGTGLRTTAVGFAALGAVKTGGDDNTALGYKAGVAITTADANTLIGSKAGDSLTTGSRNIIIGKDADTAAATDNDWLVIGDATFETAAVSASVGTPSTHKLRARIGSAQYNFLLSNA